MSTLKSENQSKGIGLGTLLTVIFIVLKLTGNIDWSWFWVLFPTILPIGLILLILIIVALTALLKKLIKK